MLFSLPAFLSQRMERSDLCSVLFQLQTFKTGACECKKNQAAEFHEGFRLHWTCIRSPEEFSFLCCTGGVASPHMHFNILASCLPKSSIISLYQYNLSSPHCNCIIVSVAKVVVMSRLRESTDHSCRFFQQKMGPWWCDTIMVRDSPKPRMPLIFRMSNSIYRGFRSQQQRWRYIH